AAHERGVGGGGELHVVDVDALAGDQPGILPALDARAEEAFGGGMGYLAPRSAMLPAACCTALTMLAYPVHRHMLPSRPRRISASLGFGFLSRIWQAEMIIPGVQNPHWSPCFSQKPSCIGWSLPSLASPSIVVTDRPSTCTANREHDFTASPSSRTVQAPHWLVSHPTCVPVSPSVSRRKWTSRSRGSTWRAWLVPLTEMVTEVTKPPFCEDARAPARRPPSRPARRIG